MADAAYAIITKDSKTTTGNFFIDEEVLIAEGVTDMKQYACDPSNAENIMPDFFLDIADPEILEKMKKDRAADKEGPAPGKTESALSGYDDKIEKIFREIEKRLNADLVQRVQAVYQFNVKGGGTWFVDLKSGKGTAGRGESSSPADATLTMEGKDFFDLFTGKITAVSAFMNGKLKISGNLQKAMKLEKLMISLKSKM